MQQQRAQRSSTQRGSKSGSSSLTMAERLASKHGVSGPSNLSFNNSNGGTSGGAMTSQLKQLLGVQSPGRPTHQRVVQNTNPAPWAGAGSSNSRQRQANQFQQGKDQARQKQANSAGQTFWGTGGRASSSNSSEQKNDALGSGEQLDADMRKWASAEMQKMKGNSDLTLVSFCMTLSSNSEIREYMRDVLGSTPQVSSFASEFIRRKNKIGSKKKRSKKR